MEKNGEFPASDEDVKNKRKHYSQFSMKEMELQKLTEIQKETEILKKKDRANRSVFKK